MPQNNVFVSYLPEDITDDSLRALFAPYGNVESARVMVDFNTRASKGFGFVKYDDIASGKSSDM